MFNRLLIANRGEIDRPGRLQSKELLIQRGVLHIVLDSFENGIVPQRAKDDSEIDEEPLIFTQRKHLLGLIQQLGSA